MNSIRPHKRLAMVVGAMVSVLGCVAPFASAAPVDPDEPLAYRVDNEQPVGEAGVFSEPGGDPALEGIDIDSLEVVDEVAAPPEAKAAKEFEDQATLNAFYDPENPPMIDGQPVLSESEIARLQEEMKVTTEQPAKPEDTPGEMWADKVDLPDDIDREQAVEAETTIAKENTSRKRGKRAASSCQRVFPTGIGVCGGIAQKYWSMGGPTSWLLWPTEPEAQNPDGQGWRQRFAGGFIFYHPQKGTYAIANRTAVVYNRNGWERGYLGYPLSDEHQVSGNDNIGITSGWMQQFDGGRIYRSSLNDGYQVAAITGRILDRWEQLGGVNSRLGFPISDEEAIGDNRGRQSIFQHGSIVWSPQTDAWEIIGMVGIYWHTDGGVNSKWGYPNGAAEYHEPSDNYFIQPFEHGTYNAVERDNEEGLSLAHGQVVSKMVLKALDYLGLASSAEPLEERENNTASQPTFNELRTRTRRAATLTACEIKNRNTAEMNGIDIPEDYEYWGCHYNVLLTGDYYILNQKDLVKLRDKPLFRDTNLSAVWYYLPAGYARHDYCTKSPNVINLKNEFYDPYGAGKKTKFDFRGACARHDMCYDNADIQPQGPFYGACNNTFGANLRQICSRSREGTNDRKTCFMVADLYKSKTDDAHEGQLWPPS